MRTHSGDQCRSCTNSAVILFHPTASGVILIAVRVTALRATGCPSLHNIYSGWASRSRLTGGETLSGYLPSEVILCACHTCFLKSGPGQGLVPPPCSVFRVPRPSLLEDGLNGKQHYVKAPSSRSAWLTLTSAAGKTE